MDSIERLGLSSIFLLLTLAGILSATADVPIGRWIGMYSSFWPIWIAVGLALLLLLVLIQYSDLPWSAVLLAAVLSALVVVNLSRLWGVPFGIRDPFRHLYEIKAGVFDFESNVYPLFHIFVRSLSEITGLSAMRALGTVSLIAATLGVGLSALSIRRLELEKRVQQTAVVAGVPIVSAGLIARPYTLGVLFVFAFIWVVTTDIRQRSIQIVLVVLTFGVLWLHPVGFIVGSAVVVTATLVGMFLNRYPIPTFEQPPAGWWIRKSFVVVIVSAFVVHLLFFSSVGGTVVDQLTDEVPDLGVSAPQETPQNTDSSSSGTQGGGGDSTDGGSDGSQSGVEGPSTGDNLPLLLQIQTEFFEFLRRASLGLLLVGAAGVLALREMISKRLHYLTTVIGIAGVLILLVFVVIDITRVQVFSPRRILAFAPILLFPVFARLLPRRASIRLGLALLVLTSGIAIMYDSPTVTGGLQNGATSAQVDGYRWYHDYGSAPLTASGSTFRIAQGVFGQETMVEWANGSWGPSRWKQRDGRHPWQVTDRPDHVVAISGFERAQGRYRAAESGNTRPVAELKRVQVENDRFYDNGNLRFYRRPN